MPAPLKSLACQNCKLKRTKCDQNWPSCSQCIRKGVRCPGPSSLIKIINIGNHVSSTTEPSEQTALQPGETSKAAVLVQREPLKQYANGHAMRGRMRLQIPLFTLSSHADTVAAQAVALVQTESLTAFAMHQLVDYSPQRIYHSSCLLDCVALSCQLWIRCFKRREPLSAVLGSKAYGKAIRSLKRAVAGDQLYTVETVGAMMLFYGFMRFSGFYSSIELLPHQLGIRRVIKQIGPPDLESDELYFEICLAHLSIMFEQIMYYPELRYTEQIQPQDVFSDLNHWFILKGESVGGDSQQEDTEDGAAETNDDDAEEDDDDSGIDDDEDTLFELIGSFYCSALVPYYVNWFPTITEILQDPSRMNNRRTALCRWLERATRKLEATRFWQRWMKLGCITECLDPDFFLGYRVEFTSFHIAQLAITMIMIEVVLRRTYYDLGSSGSAPDGDAYRRYLDACFRGWLSLPYLQSLDALSAPELLKPLIFTLEPASTEQLGHMLRLDLPWKACGFKNPEDIEGSKAWIHELAKRMTGRMPRPKDAESSNEV
ncbi:unnamed protein product [Clonostachys byssicola]|uniref:Zn(2)-C6 fungal-type domain-containing protein n=1 Tax=Clonostachys byssicola TaxID=160290 RepID=A0A9N9U840_9HYPO|nr:unnamed protein product [Clonostachys byssicola]